MQNAIIDKLNQAQEKKRPNFKVGDKVNVFVRLKEGEKERVQAFRGVVISKTPKSGRGPHAMFTVRKVSEGIGVERIFPIHSPFIERVDIETSSEIRRSRLYYLRSLKGKKARLKEMERFGADFVAAEPAPTIAQGTEIGDMGAGQAVATAAPAPSEPKVEAKKAEPNKEAKKEKK